MAVYTLSHLSVDFACAFFVMRQAGAAQGLICILVYNFCAFALQLPLGLLADVINKNKLLAALGIALVAIAPLFEGSALALCIIVGMGNALFHVGGGLDTLNDSKSKSGRLGVFVSSGAVGLYLGSLGLGSLEPLWVSLILILLAVSILLLCGPVQAQNAPFKMEGLPRRGSVALALLFLVVVLRSFVGLSTPFDWRQGLLVPIGVLCTALGKAAGGFAADRWGEIRVCLVAMTLAALLFALGSNPVCGCLALFFFNMTMPITLSATARLLKNAKGFSFGLLTLALFLGLVPVALGLKLWGGLWAIAVLTVLSLVLLIFGLKGVKALE